MKNVPKILRCTFVNTMVAVVLFGISIPSSANQQGSQNGMPFRDIQEQIDVLTVDLAEAVSLLQGEIDALVASQAEQDDLIAALESAVATLELRVDDTEINIAGLQALQDMQGQLIAALQTSVGDLEVQVDSNTADIAALVMFDQTLQDLINALQGQINTINARIDSNDVDIAALQATAAQLELDLLSAQSQLAAKQDRVDGICAAGSSIREIHPDGSVTCEADSTGSGTGFLNTYRSSDVVSIKSSIVFTRTASNSRSCTGSNYRAVGGGFLVSSHLGVGNTYRNYPSSNTRWSATVRSDSTGSRTLRTYVVCARVQ